MKCKVISPDLEINDKDSRYPIWCKSGYVVFKNIMRSGRLIMIPFHKPGHVIEGAGVPVLIDQGLAEPADDEAEAVTTMTPEERESNRLQYAAINAGIRPDDYGLFFAGAILGYQPDGSYIPGPNPIAQPTTEQAEDIHEPKS